MKALLFANTAWYLYNFRLALAQALRARGYEVVLVSPPGEHSARLEAHGFCWLPFPLSRKGVNPLRELWTVMRLVNLYRREQPVVVHHFTIKCVLYGSLAARLAGVTGVINAVTGLGYVFGSSNWKAVPLRWIVMPLYKIAFQRSLVIFQNPEDRELFIQQGLVSSERACLVRGSGVDIERFQSTPEPSGVPVVILPSRLLWDKGVGEFVEAARLLRSEGVEARFVLVGVPDPENPSSVTTGTLQAWQKEGVIEWWGWQEDMPDVFARSHVVCFPSFYREGVPKTLIEAAASGRPIVATTIPGSQEVVKNGVNGFLVAPQQPKLLAEALQRLLQNSELRQQMGANGREIALSEFSDQRILDETLHVYDSLLT